MSTETLPTRLPEYIKEILPWAHGHQIKAITAFVAAILAKQTGCQAELAHAGEPGSGHQTPFASTA